MTKATLKYQTGTNIPSQSNFCGCCGTKYINPKKPRETLENPKGICVYSGKHGEEIDTPLNSVKHVNTPEGWVTVVVDKKWA